MSDDLLATPLNKLPPPAVFTKAESGTVTAPNYNDLRDNISIPTADENRFAQQPQQQQIQQQPQNYYEPQQDYYEPMQQQQQYYDQPQYAPSIAPKKKKKRSPFFSTDTLKDKKLWLFTAIVFLLFTYGLPKLHSAFPSMVDPMTNTLKSPAIVAASIVSGLFYVFTSEFL